MPGRYELLESDEERLPDGMTRVGYDADGQVYTYQDADGSYWQGEEGNRYGVLHRTGRRGPTTNTPWNRPVKVIDPQGWRYILPFMLLVIVGLLLVFRILEPTPLKCADGLKHYRIDGGDTCWKIATDAGTTVDRLKEINSALNCDHLNPGKQICVPDSTV